MTGLLLDTNIPSELLRAPSRRDCRGLDQEPGERDTVCQRRDHG